MLLSKHGVLKKPGEIIHAACIYRGKRMLSIGWNSSYSMSCGMESSSRHAEAMAIEQLFSKKVAGQAAYLHRTKRRLHTGKNLSMLVIRLDSLDKLRQSKPCADCIALLQSFSIHTAMWSKDDGGFRSERVATLQTDFVSTGNRAWKRACA